MLNYIETLGRSQIYGSRMRLLMLNLLLVIFLGSTSVRGQLFNPEDSFVENSGDGTLLLIPASAVVTSLILKDYKGTWQYTKSLALNLVVTSAAKVIINKERPLNDGGKAFPSGHTSVAFQGASFFHRRYGFKYSIPAYLLAGYTSFSRLHATRHDGWDILAGAAVGIGSTWIFTKPRENEKLALSFSSSEDYYLLGFTYAF
ncbi:MAG TPA: phosphatase PAP2 family protein [Salegentibacter sp.]